MKNDFEIRGEEAVVYVRCKSLTFATLVDTEDIPRLLDFPYSWYACKRTYGGFVVKSKIYKSSGIYLHRFILDAPPDLYVDHINHDTLDNRKMNLRLATPSQNGQNRIGAARNSRSNIRGVRYRVDRGQWAAELKINGKHHHIGYYNDKRSAEIAVMNARKIMMPYSQEALKES